MEPQSDTARDLPALLSPHLFLLTPGQSSEEGLSEEGTRQVKATLSSLSRRTVLVPKRVVASAVPRVEATARLVGPVYGLDLLPVEVDERLVIGDSTAPLRALVRELEGSREPMVLREGLEDLSLEHGELAGALERLSFARRRAQAER